ncbi:hypothetical protein BOW57_19580 [Flavobacterium sp. YO64]|nr:hypothetical protein BOW57_19580 [Flavobacterium sp. YO64]
MGFNLLFCPKIKGFSLLSGLGYELLKEITGRKEGLSSFKDQICFKKGGLNLGFSLKNRQKS